MYSKTPDILSFSTSKKVPVLTQAELEIIKNGTLQLLSDVGVYFPSQKALKIFADHGANVDWDAQVVCIHPDLVMKAMSTASRSFVLGGREERTSRIRHQVEFKPRALSTVTGGVEAFQRIDALVKDPFAALRFSLCGIHGRQGSHNNYLVFCKRVYEPVWIAFFQGREVGTDHKSVGER